MKPADRPADIILTALRRVGLDYRVAETGSWAWKATCPVCRFEVRRTLRICETGPVGSAISLRCANGCREAEILAALTSAVREEREAAA